MIYPKKPLGFAPRFEIVSCLCEYKDKLLLLHRQDHKLQGNQLGMPAGKREQTDISIHNAIIRELLEETEISVRAEDLMYIEKFYIKYPDYEFIFHMFKVQFRKIPEVRINPNEHKSFLWTTPENALRLNLMEDLGELIKRVYQL